MRKAVKITIGVAAALVVVAAVSSQGDGEQADAQASTSVTEASAEKTSAKDKETTEPKADGKTKAEQFIAFVKKNGLSAEKKAVKHVTKVRVADETNDILDSADVYTDLTGDIVSGDASTARLIASAFADWKQSKNGLVTVYNADGEMLDNGEF